MYVAAAWLIAWKSKQYPIRLAVVGIAIALPFWDFPLGYLALRSNCEKNGGVTTFTTWPPVKAVFVETTPGYSPEEALKHGVQTVEYGAQGNIVRFTASNKGFAKTFHEKTVSEITFARLPRENLAWNIEKNTLIAKRTVNGELIAQQVTYRWHGMWWQLNAGPILGGGMSCPEASKQSLIEVIARGS